MKHLLSSLYETNETIPVKIPPASVMNFKCGIICSSFFLLCSHMSLIVSKLYKKNPFSPWRINDLGKVGYSFRSFYQDRNFKMICLYFPHFFHKVSGKAHKLK